MLSRVKSVWHIFTKLTPITCCMTEMNASYWGSKVLDELSLNRQQMLDFWPRQACKVGTLAWHIAYQTKLWHIILPKSKIQRQVMIIATIAFMIIIILNTGVLNCTVQKLWYDVLYCTELLVDNGSWQKQKSSGVMICPGTGSTSWHLNVNHVSFQAVQEILQVGKNDSSQLSCTVDCKNGQKLIYSEMPRPV